MKTTNHRQRMKNNKNERKALHEFQIQITFFFLNSERTQTKREQNVTWENYAEQQNYVGIFALSVFHSQSFSLKTISFRFKTLLYNQYH